MSRVASCGQRRWGGRVCRCVRVHCDELRYRRGEISPDLRDTRRSAESCSIFFPAAARERYLSTLYLSPLSVSSVVRVS